MCGRYTLTVQTEPLLERFALTEAEQPVSARFNIAPTQSVAVILNDSPQRLSMAQWGLIPSWSKDPKLGMNLINARSESILEKPSFNRIFKTRRCLVLADGFYEWKKNPDGSRTPYYVSLTQGGAFAMAGLWDVWESPEGNPLRTCTIITTEANELLAPLHERMAVILPPSLERTWLSDAKPPELLELLKPFPADQMRAFEVSRKVNAVKNDDASLIEPVAQSLKQIGLF
ncbi:MAG: SOS response-associated peptidase [Blastocatellia bacterium]|nr:SOS response-associated peptidase [Blastocatellia bacterium]